MNKVMSQIEKVGIVPVVKINDLTKALPLCKALLQGGINVVEITFRTDCAADAIKEISSNCKDMIVGAGTIINVEQAKKAIECGAKFIVSPAKIRLIAPVRCYQIFLYKFWRGFEYPLPRQAQSDSARKVLSDFLLFIYLKSLL